MRLNQAILMFIIHNSWFVKIYKKCSFLLIGLQ